MLRRTPFKPRVTARDAIDASARRAESIRTLMAGMGRRVVSMGGTTGAAIDKFVYVRSKPLLIACRAIPCQHCGRSDGTVVAAHSNELRHGKGRSVKASDVFVASLCFACHHELDQGAKWTKAERQGMWDVAHRKTVALLVANGMWPVQIPIPDLRRFN